MTGTWKQWEGEVVNGEFTLRQYLGGSDRCAVFLTEKGKPEPQRAAIKLIPADPGSAELQLSRWRLAARLSHPHLIQIFQMGRCQLGERKLLYVVMEYAEEDLSQVLPNRPLTSAEITDMLKAVLDALAYLHGKGFAHSHLKPANIMALGDQIKISSDGLCRMGERGARLGKADVYDPPEAANGTFSPAGDVWSLGMTLVEALTQRLPVWEKTGKKEPELPANMPTPLADLARHCLHRKPRRRWTVAEITAWLRLTSALPGAQREASQKQTVVTPHEVFTKWRYVVSTAAVALALAAILFVPSLLDRHPQAQLAPETSSEESRVQPGPQPSSTWPKPAVAAKTPTGNLVQGEVFQKILPDVPQKALDTIRGTVRVGVRVSVNLSGRVTEATLESTGPSRYFAKQALQAARRWEFWAPKVDGRSVPSEWILRFEFTQAEMRAFPAQVVP